MFIKARSLFSFAFFGLLVILTFSLIAGCQAAKRHWPPKTGQVLDADTRQPIADAIVLANWKGMVSFSNTRCFHQVRDTTDEQGHFHISAWENQESTAKSSYQSIYITTHKYQYKESKRTELEQSQRDNIYYLEMDDSSPIERLRYLNHFVNKIGCGPHKGSKDRLFPVIKSIYQEAINISSTDNAEEQELVRQIQNSISLYWRDKDPLWTPDQFDKYFEDHVRKELLK